MNLIFWSVASIDALLFAGLLVTYAAMPGANASGGKEMGIFFLGIVPLAILSLTALLFYFSRSALWKYLALAIALGPGLIYANVQIQNGLIDYRIRQKQLGRWYFKDPDLKVMGAAVVQRDIPTLSRLGPHVALDTVGDGGMTLIRLAAEQVPTDDLASAPVRAAMTVVQELLRLGATPGPALAVALKTEDPVLLQSLLARGADPNAPADGGQPVVFEWLRTMPPGHLTLLIEHGLDVNARQYHTSLALTAALHRRFDLVLLLARHGADLRTPRDDGRDIAAEIAGRRTDAKAAGVEPAAELAPIESILTAQLQGPT